MSGRHYEINFEDNTVQTVDSQSVKTEGEWLVFLDGVGEVLRVRAAEVSNVARTGIPARAPRQAQAA